MISQESIETFLRDVDRDFTIPLTARVSVSDLAKKYFEKATLCCRFKDEKIIAMVAGYLDHTKDQMGYISLVAAAPNARRKGYSSALLEEFLELAKHKGLKAVHVYTHRTNEKAIGMYQKLGFVRYFPEEEPRPEEIHFIFYLDQ